MTPDKPQEQADKPVYRRVLLKLSGEALMGSSQFGIDPATLQRALALQARPGAHRALGRILVDIGALSELRLRMALAEWQGEVVDGLAVVRGIAQLATELHLGERDHVLQPDQPALEGENGRSQPHLRRRRDGPGVRRRRRPDQGGRQSNRQTGPQQRLHMTLRDCSAKS